MGGALVDKRRGPDRAEERPMPHVIVKLYPGRSETLKAKLAEEITKTLISTLNSSDDAISVGIEDVSPERWTETVYEPEIIGKSETIYKTPGYGPQ
jgi:4-oxalocrotonate tautomerase